MTAPRLAIQEAHAWLVKAALPLWSGHGFDAAAGRFRERLHMDRQPVVGVPLRLMVQCRQIYVFAHAHLLGWRCDRPMVEAATARLLADFHEADGEAGFVFAVTAEGKTVDARRDAYGHAFAVFALAWAHRVTGDGRLIDVADRTLHLLGGQHATLREGPGLLDAPDAQGIHRQNPYMHLLEATLALYDATGRKANLDRAADLVDLCMARFYRPDAGVIAEYLDANWRPLSLPVLCEPGHLFEWVWLLRAYEDRCGRSVGPQATVLYDRACAMGFDAEGLIVDETTEDGRVTKADRRLWPHAEAVKATSAEHRTGRPGCRPRTEAILGRILDRYCDTEGGWVDHLSPQGAPLVDHIPASSLYHLFSAVAEAQVVFCPERS